MFVIAPVDPLNFRDWRLVSGIESVPPIRELRWRSLPGMPSIEVLVEGRPQTRPESVTYMGLSADDWILLSHGASIVIVCGEEPHPKVDVKEPVPETPRYSKFGFDAPTVGADIDESRRVILAQRSGHDKAGPHNGFSSIGSEFFQIHGGRAIEVHGETHGWIH
jgi:hypothetical protein